MNTGLMSSAATTTLRFDYDSHTTKLNSYNSPISAASPYSSSSSPSPINSSSSSTNSSASLISKSFALLSDYEDRKQLYRAFEKPSLSQFANEYGRACEDGNEDENSQNSKRKSDGQIAKIAAAVAASKKDSQSPVPFSRGVLHPKRFKFSHSAARSVDQSTDQTSPEQSRPASADNNDSQTAFTVNYSSESYFKLKDSPLSNEDKPTEADASGLRNKFFRDFFFNLRDSVLRDPDTSLVLENGQSLSAHEVMLVNSSPYFRRKLNKITTNLDDEQLKQDRASPKSAKLKHCIKLSGVKDYASLKICMDFIYSGGTDISLPSTKLKSIRKTAEILELSDLVKLCISAEKLLESKQPSHAATSSAAKSEPSPVPQSQTLASANESSASRCFESSNVSFQPTSLLQQLSNCQNIQQMMLQQQQQQQQQQQSNAMQANSSLLLDPLFTTTYLLNQLSNAAVVAAAQKQSEQMTNSFNRSVLQPADPPKASISSIGSAARNAMMKKSNSIDQSFTSSFLSADSLKMSHEKLLSFKSNSFHEASSDATANQKPIGVDKIFTQGHQLLSDPITLEQVRDYVRKLTTDPFGAAIPKSAMASALANLFKIDTISKEFMIKDKYIYPSLLRSQSLDKATSKKAITDQLDEYLSNYSYIDSTFSQDGNSTSQFNRQSLLIFSINVGDTSKFGNFVIKCSLDFTNINSLRENIKKSLELSMIQTVNALNMNQLTIATDQAKPAEKPTSIYHTLSVDVSQFFYLKKPSNCKTIRMEPIKSSTDCFRAIVEYSRSSLANELPCVLVTASANVSLKPI